MLLGLTSLSCADALGFPTNPQVVAGPWHCLGNLPPIAAPTAPTALVQVHACNFVSGCTTAVTGLTAEVCDKRDVGCIAPRETNLTDVGGDLRFSVSTFGGGFDGYLLVNSMVGSCLDAQAFGPVAGPPFCGILAPTCDAKMPDARCMIPLFAPSMLFFNPAIQRDVQTPVPLRLLPLASLPAIVAASGLGLDPGTGTAILQALDCDGKPAAGVTFILDQGATQAMPVYMENGVVSVSVRQTDASGQGGFSRIPPGFVSIVGINSQSVRVGQVGILAQAQMMTYGTLVPSP